MNSPEPIESFHAVIPAGGAGTRLWPLSRSTKPKFLLDLTGSGRSLIQQTWDRLEPLVGADHIHVVTGSAHAAAIAEQLPDLAHLIVEPAPRDSMPAIGLAAALIERHNPGAIIGSFAADHIINDTVQFGADVAQAVAVARTGRICTIGIEPAEASTAFGYIEAGEPLGLGDAPDARDVVRFVEKPDADTARAYLSGGGFSWNAGMFITSAEVLLGHLAELQPVMYERLTTIAESSGRDDHQTVLEHEWSRMGRIAIDHAIAEPVAARGGVAVVPGRFDWSDLGDFAALSELDTAPSDVVFIDAEGLVIAPGGKAVTVIGIPGIVVIDTGDALLITTRDHAQRVKEAPLAWQERGRGEII